MERGTARRVALIALLCAATAIPCSFDYTPTFAFRVRPDEPVDDYIGGNLGVVQPTYARSWLVIAYRYFSGNPLSAEERAGFLELLERRLGEASDSPLEWEKLRATVRGVKPGDPPRVDRDAGSYAWFTNCTDDAFRTAMATLGERSKTFGVRHPATIGWLDAQETVFANCSDGEQIPKPAEAALPDVIRADRAYQIAAAHFYAMHFDEARQHFLAVASDARSPWRQTARIAAVRALLRKSTLQEENALDVAEKELRAILADPSMSPRHGAARQLLGFAASRNNPNGRLREAAASLAKRSISPGTDLADFTYLIDHEAQSDDDLTDWVLAFQNGGPRALERWRVTKKPHWLVAALVHATEKEAAELIEASKNVRHPTVVHHRARLLLAAKRIDAAREELDRALGNEQLPPSARNTLRTQRLQTARSLAELLRDAHAVPVGLEVEQRPWESWDGDPAPFLVEEAAPLINALTVEKLAEAAESELPESVRRPIVIAAWTRALLLDREDVAARLAPRMIAIDASLAPYFEEWRKAQGDRRTFAAANLIVRFGALQPYVDPLDSRAATSKDIANVLHGGRNWWCAGTLTDIGSGPTWMLGAIVEWANARPKDAGVAEALSLAIHGTRWACGDSATDKLAERAFNLLHKKYGGTKWAKETPYWYRDGG